MKAGSRQSSVSAVHLFCSDKLKLMSRSVRYANLQRMRPDDACTRTHHYRTMDSEGQMQTKQTKLPLAAQCTAVVPSGGWLWP